MPEWNGGKRPRSWADGIRPSRKARGKRDFGSGCVVLILAVIVSVSERISVIGVLL